MTELLQFTSHGLYCPAADVYLDPWKPVPRALITHGHSDHARWGHQYYLCTEQAAPIIRYRLPQAPVIETIRYGEPRVINGVRFSFHPAGHIFGSAQIRVEHQGRVWVFSGDYKLHKDGLAAPFEPISCHDFITESTFGLPVYQWQPPEEVFADVNAWWRQNQAEEKVSVLAAYALGKAQRLLLHLDESIGKILVHGALHQVHQILVGQGVLLPKATLVTSDLTKSDFRGAMVLCPPSALGSPWMRKFQPYSVGIASGWMSLRGTRRRRGADRGFALSDHADWPGLVQAVKATGAERVWVTHGYQDTFARWLRTQGYEAQPVTTQFEGEADAESPEGA
jgi:putative mRNA 3-end processing factor